MNLNISYTEKGTKFELVDGNSCCFPIDYTSEKQAVNHDWLQLNATEQLWYDGLLELDLEGKAYYLSPDNYYRIDAETKAILNFPKEDAVIGIAEQGNIGSKNYDIYWFPKIGNRTAGKTVRYGNVIGYAGVQSCLTEEQYKLICAIENHEPFTDIVNKGRFHAHISMLANRANAQMSDFMQKREFVFADETTYRLSSNDDHSLRLVPLLSGVPEELQVQMPGIVSSNVRLQNGVKRTTVFTSPKAQNDYNMIGSIPELKDEQVPEFLDNPYMFLPESIDIDLDEFGERVKGLKIKKATAVPYVHIEQDKEKPGWYNIENGFHFNTTDEWNDTSSLEYTEELKQLMDEASKQGQRYIYYNNQWIKIDPETTRRSNENQSVLENKFHNHVPIEKVAYVLEIYDNLNEVEYNEEILEIKTKSTEGIPLYAVPNSFTGALLEHQQIGYSFLRGHYETKTGVLLADDMGLGKTVQIIALLAYLYDAHELATTLIVMPRSLLENWKEELHKFLPSEKSIYVHQGPQRYKSQEMIASYEIVLTTYEILARDQIIFGRISWTCVICDEVQKIKNFQTAAANVVKGMNTRYRIAMTGTPVENRLSELWSIVDFTQPGLLAGYKEFKKRYETPIASNSQEKDQIAKELIDKLSPIFIRRTKEDVLANKLPEKKEYTIPIAMDSSTETLYRNIIAEIGNQKGMVLATITKLLEVCSHPRLVVGGDLKENSDLLIKESPKIAWTINKIGEIFDKNEKVIIFTKYKTMQAILRKVIFQKYGIDAPIINGDITGNRSAIIQAFSNTIGAHALILAPRAAGVGLTITAANHVIHYTREWNPAVENQATDRVYRIGQTKPVSVYYPILQSKTFITVEDKLDNLLCDKRELMKSVIVPANLDISIEDFSDILDI